MQKTICELFAGVGGFRLGFDRLGSGWETVWFSQWEPGARTQWGPRLLCAPLRRERGYGRRLPHRRGHQHRGQGPDPGPRSSGGGVPLPGLQRGPHPGLFPGDRGEEGGPVVADPGYHDRQAAPLLPLRERGPAAEVPGQAAGPGHGHDPGLPGPAGLQRGVAGGERRPIRRGPAPPPHLPLRLPGRHPLRRGHGGGRTRRGSSGAGACWPGPSRSGRWGRSPPQSWGRTWWR